MNNLKTEQLNIKLEELSNFIHNQSTDEIKTSKMVENVRKIFNIKVDNRGFKESEILNWIAECVSFFSEVKVNHVVIDNFLNFFKFSSKEGRDGLEKRIGPFVTVGWDSKSYWSSDIIDFDFTKIAFQCAKTNIDKLEQEERIVPKYLLKSIFSHEISKKLLSSLKLIEDCYQKKDANGMITQSNILLDEILSMDEDLLKIGKNVGPKLDFLLNNEEKLIKFCADKNVVSALNAFRIIRNKRVAHSEIPVKYNIPFIVAVSYVSLTIFFLECCILSSDIFKSIEKNA